LPSSNLKIALVITNLRGGGAEKAFLKLAALMQRRGHDVHLFLLENIVEHLPETAVTVHALTGPGRALGKGFVGKRLAAARLRRQFRQQETERAFDFTLVTLPFADEVVHLAGLPRVWHRIANTLSVEIENLRQRSASKASRRLARYRRLYRAKNLIAVSDGVAEDLQGELGLTDANIVRLYNPFDLNEIRRLAAEIPAGLPREPYVVHVGRFAPQKRHDLLFNAWRIAALPHKLVLLTPPSPALDAVIADAGIAGSVIIAGFQQNPYPWIRGADALVLSSDHEGLPNVLIEALICGTQIVSTDCPSGPREIMTGALARFLVPAGDAQALAAALREAVSNPIPLADVNLSRFSDDTVAQGYEGLPARWREPG
jgi:glycosyltransferase involved in cell wall biosynthesis